MSTHRGDLVDHATLQGVLTRTDERIAQARQDVNRQREIVAEKESRGLDVRRAMKALAVFEQILSAHVVERDQLVILVGTARSPA